MVFPYKRSKSGLKKRRLGKQLPFFCKYGVAGERKQGRAMLPAYKAIWYKKHAKICIPEKIWYTEIRKKQKTPIPLRGRAKRVRLPVSGFGI